MGKHDAIDGLMIKDLTDLATVQGLATFIGTPPRIVVRRTLSKAKHEYFTFISDLGVKRLLAYLNQRILGGEYLGPDALVIAPSTRYNYGRGKNEGKKFLTTPIIEREVRMTMRPRFHWRPYVLRAFFNTELLIAESRGKIAHDFRVFFMGHKGSIEAKYTANKGILPKALIDEMREAFKRREKLLDLEDRGRPAGKAGGTEIEDRADVSGRTCKGARIGGMLTNGKTDASNGSSQGMKQNDLSENVGSMQGLYQTEKSSSRVRSRIPRVNGPGGLRSFDLRKDFTCHGFEFFSGDACKLFTPESFI
ncbi:MAG: hypothetical protein QXP61_09245 [Nitrososphaerales archaeon]